MYFFSGVKINFQVISQNIWKQKQFDIQTIKAITNPNAINSDGYCYM